MKAVSVIVPAYNEEKNIKPLAERIHLALSQAGIKYEIIFVDDRSDDRTAREIKKLYRFFPVHYHLKNGAPGKARSILEGAAIATYDYLVMIDADLQYPPESIPQMLDRMETGSDIVIGDRQIREESRLRSFVSHSYSFLFAKMLHKLECDVQSGLKAFRREILERLRLNPTPWSFDTEFLVKARAAGYSIGSVPIAFAKRIHGSSKINLLKSSFEVGLAAIRLKFADVGTIPFSRRMKSREGVGFHYGGKKFFPYSRLPRNEIALETLSKNQLGFSVIFLLTLLNGLTMDWHDTITLLVAILTVLYATDLLFYLFLISRSFSRKPEIQVSQKEIDSINHRNLPVYTIFCPLYREWQVIPQFVEAMSKLDYPKDKLQVMLILEENDKKTIEKVQEFSLPAYFEVVVVPHSSPKTKPKALNYGMQFMRGKFAVVYDAEDMPDPLQLKKAILAFGKASSKTTCVQAKLNFFNPRQNILTRLFTLEYSLWFDLILPGLQSINGPIPLGGTSNHFKASDLLRLKGWDAFNVTEDADLGMRLFKKGYYTQVFDSTTLEEANSNLINWYHQRTRWIKGYIQTYLVHMRSPHDLRQQSGIFNFLIFQLVVGGKFLLMFVNPLMWFVTIVYFAFRPAVGGFIESFFPAPVFYMGVASLVAGNFLYFYYYMIGAAKRKQYGLIKYGFLVPFYWLFMSAAAWGALYSMIVAPHYWAKTIHGLHLNPQKPATSYPKKIVPAFQAK